MGLAHFSRCVQFVLHSSGCTFMWPFHLVSGSMLVNILVPGTVKSCGVLIVEFSEAFHASASSTAWIPSLCYFLYSSLGNFTLRILDRKLNAKQWSLLCCY